MVYLDANATEPLRPSARAAVLAALDVVGNPASVHQAGRVARRVIEDAREVIAARFAGRPADLVFTSGGTEADALAVHALGFGRRLAIGATEHDAVRSAAAAGVILPVDVAGVVLTQALRALLADAVPTLVCVMLANNETGTIQPIAEIAAICRAAGALLHVDAVQAAGRMDVDFNALGAHSLAISAHKLGGPKGVGALLVAPELTTLAPLIGGGGQERGRRGGTPALPAIAGFAAAVAAGGDTGTAGLAELRDAIERQAVALGAVALGAGAPRLGNTTCLALAGVRADAQVMALDLDGFAVSAGAACSSGKVAESHVLAAMGLGALAGQAIRVSLPWNATRSAVEAFIPAYARMAERLTAALALPPRAA